MSRSFEIYTDGACRGNPGPAAIAYVIKEDGKVLKEFSKFIGQGTNNIAEYTALIYALQDALALKANRVHVYTDSELMYKQCIGSYRVANPHIKPLFEQCQHLAKRFQSFHIAHVLRDKNKAADELAKRVLKKEQAQAVAFPLNNGGEESPGSKG